MRFFKSGFVLGGMKNYSEKYGKIVDELVKESFPELGKIRLFNLKSRGLFGLSICFFGTNFLWLNYSKLSGASDKVVRGIIAHELSHFVIYSRRGFFDNWKVWIFYWFSSRVRSKEENMTDRFAIERGYGKFIFESTKFIVANLDKENKKVFEENYLSSDEIKSYAKEIGKW